MRFAEVLFAILMVGVALGDEVQMKDRVLTKDVTGNRTVRLVGAWVSQSRGQNLWARFVEMEPTPGKEFDVRFPAHSHTTHETTLMNVIYPPAPAGTDPYKLREPEFEIVFSIPKDAHGRVLDFDRWYLVSIKPSEVKKEQPKAAEKALPGAGERPIVAGPQNRAVRLVGVRFSEGRRHDLLVKFAEVGPQQGREIELGMGVPIGPTRDQTTVDVTHTRTILNIIKSGVSGTPLPNHRFDVTQWREPLFEAIFSIPQDAQGYVTDFKRWCLVSIRLPEPNKKGSPRPPDK